MRAYRALECQCAEWWLVSKFCPKIGCHGNVPFGINKKCEIYNLTFGKKNPEISPADTDIIGL